MINWNNFSLKILEENQIFSFGYLIYKIDKHKFRYMKYEIYDDATLNRFCSSMNYDNFQSFSMKSFRKEVNAYKFSTNKKYFKWDSYVI